MTGQRTHSIRSKILSRTVLVSLVPLVVLGAAAITSLGGLQRSVDQAFADTQTELADQVAGRGLRQDSAELSLRLERHLGERVDDIVAWSDAPVVQDALSGEDPASAERFLRGRVEVADTPFLALALTDVDRRSVVAIDGPEVPAEPDVSWIQPAIAEGGFLGPVDATALIPYLDMAVRVERPDGRPLGVLWAAVDADFFGSMAETYRSQQESDVDVSVYSRDGALMAETASGNSEGRLFDPNVVRTPQQQEFLDQGVAVDPDEELPPSEAYIEQDGDFAAHGFVTEVPSELRPDLLLATDWVTEVKQPASTALAPLAAASQVPDALDSSLSTVFLALGAAVIVAFLASVAVGRILANNIVRPITRLRDEADDVAGDRLPAAVAVTAEGGEPPLVAPIDVGTDDEVGELADSFNEVQRTAVDLAADQARLRRNFSDLFVYLGRRNQNLLGRQLELIDDLEQEEEDPDLLGSMFQLDHMATRMRRNAESLLVIAGEEPTRTWAEPVAVRDVVRAASSEVEDYARVRLGSIADIRIRGEAVSDLAHLLAELLENGLRFSPSPSPVTVCGQRYGEDGYALSVSDKGLGLGDEELEAINRRMAATPDHDPAEDIPTSSLGLFVVKQLARRHGCRVLLTSEDRGVVAWILLPPPLLTAASGEGAAPPATARADTAAPARSAPASTERHRPDTADEALTLRPLDPDQPIEVAEPERPEPAGPDPLGETDAPAPSHTASGLSRRVSRARRPRPAAPGTPDPTDAATPPRRRSAAEVGRGLRSFQEAVERGRSETQPVPGDEPS